MKLINNINSTKYFTFSGEIIQIFSIVASSISTIISKYCLIQISYISFIIIYNISTSILCCILILLNRENFFKCFNTYLIKICFKVAFCNIIGLIFYFQSIKLLHPALFGLYSRFFIVFSICYSVFYFKEKFSSYEITLILILLLGTFLSMFKPEIQMISLNFIGFIICITHCFFFSASYLLIKKHTEGSNSKIIVFLANLLSSISILILCFVNSSFTEVNELFIINKPILLLLIFCTSWFSLASILLFFNSCKFISFYHSMAIRSLSPLILYIISLPIFVLDFNLWNVIGFLLTIISLFFISLIKSKKRTISS